MASEVWIERGDFDEPFVVINRETAQKLQSVDALAIYVFLRSQAGDWRVQNAHLQQHFDIGRDRVTFGLRTLESVGLAELRTIRGARGRVQGRRWRIFSRPRETSTEALTNRSSVKPKVGQTEARSDRKSVSPSNIKREKESNNVKNVNKQQSDVAFPATGSIHGSRWHDLLRSHCRDRSGAIPDCDLVAAAFRQVREKKGSRSLVPMWRDIL